MTNLEQLVDVVAEDTREQIAVARPTPRYWYCYDEDTSEHWVERSDGPEPPEFGEHGFATRDQAEAAKRRGELAERTFDSALLLGLLAITLTAAWWVGEGVIWLGKAAWTALF